MTPCLRTLAVVFLLTVVSTAPAWAQATAALTGTVTDPTDAVVPGAELRLTNPATGVTLTATTGADGVYVFARLAPATYRLEVSAQGFKTAVREQVVIQVGLTSTLNVELEVGAVAETVEVQATVAAINQSDASIGNVISGTHIANLPTLNLDPAGLLIRPHTDETQGRQVFDQGDELKGSRSVVPLQKPAVPLGHDERGRDEAGWIREQPSKQGMVAVGPIHEGDER